MKPSTPKEMHFVSKTYLDGWLFNDTQIYFFKNKECNIGEPRNPASCLKEDHIYTVDFETLLLLQDCLSIKEDFVSQIEEIFIERGIYTKYNNQIIDFKQYFLSNNYCLDEWEFYSSKNNNRASSAKILNQIKRLRSYILEREFSRLIENNWKRNLENFLIEIKNAKQTQSGDRIISNDCLSGVIQFAIITMLRNPKTDPFGLKKGEERIYDSLKIDEKGKCQLINAHFIKQVYDIIFDVGNNAFNIIEDIYCKGKFQITLFKASHQSSFITSDNCSFISNCNFHGMLFPLNERFLLIVGSGKNSKLNEINCELLDSDTVKMFNRMIFDNAIRSVVSSEKNLNDILF